MSAQIVFLTLFLGLTSGIQPVDLHVDGPVRSIRILVDGHEAATLHGPPWRAHVDFGPLAPQDLVAVGYDATGQEIARASQLLNFPRPMAEFDIALEHDGKVAALRWHHLMNVKPKSASATIDGTPLALDSAFRAALPKLDPMAPHVVSAEMRFEDGTVARRDLVLEGLRSDSVGTELTPVLLLRKPDKEASALSGCFSAGSTPVHVSAVEKPQARVVIVQEPFPGQAIKTYDVIWAEKQTFGIRNRFPLSADTSAWLQWPIAKNYAGDSDDRGATSTLFARSPDLPAKRGGMLWLLTRSFADRGRLDDPRRFADAVAVAGLNATEGGFRRAVVLVLSDRKDASQYDPRSVRHYLQSLGVPLFVWSLDGPRPDLADSWGDVEDISTTGKLGGATARLRRVLDSELVAWLAVDPLTALHVQAKESCGVTPAAQPTR